MCNGNWWFVAGLTAFLAYYVPRSYGTPHHLNGEGNVWCAPALPCTLPCWRPGPLVG